MKMSKKEAKKIRKWRVEDEYSWCKIAEVARGYSSQLIGMDLCKEAAEILGEDYRQDPWN